MTPVEMLQEYYDASLPPELVEGATPEEPDAPPEPEPEPELPPEEPA